MTRGDAVRLVALAAIWGASFLFMRVAAPAIGPVPTAAFRMLIGGGALAAYHAWIGFDPEWRRWWRHYAGIGVINSAAPFFLYAYAALALPAGLMAVLNATAPIWGAVLSLLFLGERLSFRRSAGLVLGIGGVAVLCGPEASDRWLAIVAGLGGALCYAVAGVAMRRSASAASSRGMAAGTQLLGAFALVPLLAVAPPVAVPGPGVLASLLALGLLCSGVAYVLYFRLVSDIGAGGALTVTYLIPVFGVLWGALFLGEPLSAAMLAGAALVIAGTALVLRG